jgi:translation elongation factor EF-1alpha
MQDLDFLETILSKKDMV